VGVLFSTELRLWRDDLMQSYDAAIIVLAHKVCDEGQRNFLKRLGNNTEALSFFDQVLKTRGKEVGEFWMPGDHNLLLTWISLPSINQSKYQAQVLEEMRKCVGKKLRGLAQDKVRAAVIVLPEGLGAAAGGWDLVVKELAVVTQLASYSFFLGAKQPLKALDFVDVVLPVNASSDNAFVWGNTIGHYTNLARRWGDMPAGSLTPQLWAQQAAREAGAAGCSCTILDSGQMRALGMGGVLGVGSGASHKPLLIILDYEPANPVATIALAGKGIIFDSGGLQIKPGTSMLGMKFDKCGGAAALATCLAAAKLQAPVRVIAIVPAVYNKTGGDAMHPRDILHMMNGTTVEVNHTDCEGRLILADALCYAEKFYNPNVIIDIATLTGACVAALGRGYSGMMSWHDRLKSDLKNAGNVVGDRVWELPFDHSYDTANISDVADISNQSRATWGAGSIMGGLFLSKFVENKCWAHLDIAGTANGVPDSWYASSGATGAGVRLLVEYITNYQIYDHNAA
jgi:leucyl aminopeptidase